MLDVLLGSPLDDYWNVDGDRGLSAVDQFYPVHNIKEKPSNWIHVVRGEIDKSSGNIHAGFFWPDDLSNM